MFNINFGIFIYDHVMIKYFYYMLIDKDNALNVQSP